MNFTQKSHGEIEKLLGNVSIAVDATVGAGFDALFATSILNDGGKVFCFDVQSEAIARSKLLLEKNNVLDRAVFFETGHENMESVLPIDVVGCVDCVFFNLGWLPRSDKKISTKPDTTISALQSALRIVNRKKSVLSVLCYKAHDGGYSEFRAVENFLVNSGEIFERFTDVTNPLSPELFVVKIGAVKK